MKSKSFNAVFCVPLLKLSINGLFATPSMGGLLIFQLLQPRRLLSPCVCKYIACEKIVGKFKLRSRSAWVAWSIYPQWAGGHTCTGHHSISLMTLWAQFNSVCSRIKFWGLYLLGKCLTGVLIQLLIRNLGNGEAELHMKAFSSWREDRFRSQVWGKHTCDEWPSLGLSVKAMLLHFWVIWHFLQNQDELKQAKSRGDICSKCLLLWWGPFPFKTVGAPPQWSKDANYL